MWQATLPREPFNQTLRDVDTAWRNFFGGRAKRPRRRKFGKVQSARFTLDQRRLGLVTLQGKRGSVQLDGIGRVRFRMTEPMPGRLRAVTGSRDSAGWWLACFTADGLPPAAAALSTGEIIAAPKF